MSRSTLARGVSHDTAFEDWANLVWRLGAGMGAEVGLQDFRKDIVIEFYNEAGQSALAYKVYRCWVSEYQALPALDADTSEVAIQSIRLENEGWERDRASGTHRTEADREAGNRHSHPSGRPARRGDTPPPGQRSLRLFPSGEGHLALPA